MYTTWGLRLTDPRVRSRARIVPMSTHIAWIYSDIVAGVASYLPAADVTTLFNAGTGALNCVLQKYIDRYLDLTARDVDLFYTYMNRFQYIRSVFMKGCCKIDKMKFKMPPLTKEIYCRRIGYQQSRVWCEYRIHHSRRFARMYIYKSTNKINEHSYA